MKQTKINSVIVRYGEISLKGKNRLNFELLLKSDIERFLEMQANDFSAVILKRGRIYLKGVKKTPDLHKVLGIYSYSPAWEIAKDFSELKRASKYFFSQVKKVKSFRVSCQRIDKKFVYDSIETEKIIGEIILKETKIPVNLKQAEIEIHIEIGEDNIYIFTEKIPGFAGFPYGSAGKLVALISSGFDSPVATFLMMKRGIEPILLHFKISDSDYQKVLNLKRKLEEYTSGRKIKIYDIERDELFKGKFTELYQNKKYHSYICILCKFLMHKKAGEIARKEGTWGIITGDNIAQVASQTLKNLYAYRTVSGLPVYSPLIGFEKTETIHWARVIGTYDISVLKSDACLPPRTPVTGVNYFKFKKILAETNLDD